ncbi:hypothetical protein KJ786_01610 [Patescibacteria group bacterium]|nr:hypothetical protein [Patescibacteria group bacterium]
MKNSFLSKNCKDIILGSLLGDGSLKINDNYKNARFSFRHSIKQKEYFFWKVNELKEISGENYFWKSEIKDGFGGQKLRYQSVAIPELTELYDLTHKKGVFKISRKWLNAITPLSLAIWWLDDGSIIGNGRKGVFCTDCFSYEEQKLLSNYLKKVWDINVHIGKITRKWMNEERIYYRLWIRSSEELKKFLRIIMPHIKVAEMLPKVLIIYKDHDLQQRWISEVSELTGFSKAVVEKYITEKKNKWKNFRK